MLLSTMRGRIASAGLASQHRSTQSMGWTAYIWSEIVTVSLFCLAAPRRKFDLRWFAIAGKPHCADGYPRDRGVNPQFLDERVEI